MEEQANRPFNTPPPLPKKVEDEAAQKPERAIFLTLILGGGGGGGGYKFPISSVQDILSVIVAGLWILHCIAVGFFSLWLSQLEEFLGFKN